jgi:hypothetical protein
MRILCIALLIAVAAPAHADEAGRLNREGLKAAKTDLEVARQKFEQSYALDPRPLTLYNLAAAQANTNRLVEARANYVTFLAQTKAGQDEQFRAAALKALPTLATAIPTMTIVPIGFGSDITIELDGKPLLAADLREPVPANPGPHAIVVRRDAETIERRELTLVRGARERIELKAPLPKVVEPPPTKVIVTTPPPPPPKKTPASKSFLSSKLFWGLTSVVVVGAAASAGYYFLYYDQSDPTRGTLGPGVLELP